MEPIRAIRVEGISELSSSSRSLERRVSPSRQDGLKLALSKMSLLRGEVMDSVRLESYSKALGEEFTEDYDTLYVLDGLVKSRRGEYEAKIPEMGDLLEMVRDRRLERLRALRDRKRRDEHEAYLKDVRDNPDNYITMQQLLADIAAKKAAKETA